ncbi:TIGR03089 family protein [Arcanobacterium canis]
MSHPDLMYQQLLKIGTSPALTVYGEDRIELSGKVLANHVAKIANFLVDEIALEPGNRVALDLPVHWKTIAWGLAALTAGGNVVVGRAKIADAEPGTVIVTANPRGIERDPDDTIVALALGSLAISWVGDLEPDVYDGVADVMSFPDALMFSGRGENSNASFYSRAIDDIPAGRIALHKPSVIESLCVAYTAFSHGDSLVITGSSASENVLEIEHASLFTPSTRL